ncbi:MAG TPA: HlyD family secretion protein [Bryobacteraceae bacterium]|nr:HlyD family secretion protein [Bryobacteraceae bacterium]
MGDLEVEPKHEETPEPPSDSERQRDAAPRRPLRRRLSYFRQHPRAKWVILAIVVVLAVAGYLIWQYESARESTDDAQIEGHIDPISARVGGRVIAVNFEDNQYVRAGTVLVQIDPRDYQIALERAESDLATARATAQAARTNVPILTTTTGSQTSTARAGLEQAQSGVTAAEKEVDAAKSRLSAAKANLGEAQASYAKAAADVERYKPLLAHDDISKQQFQAAVTAADVAQGGVDAARAAIAEAEQGIAVAQSHVSQARASVAQAEANVRAASSAPQQIAVSRAQANAANGRVLEAEAAVDQARLNLQYTTVTAPVAGMLQKKSVEIGQNVQPNQPLAAIVPLEDIWVTALFKETQMRYMQPGQRVTISVDTYGGRKYEGYVESIAPATGETFSLLPPENASGNYVKVVQRIPVRIRFKSGQDPQYLLRPGMSVEPTVMVK